MIELHRTDVFLELFCNVPYNLVFGYKQTQGNTEERLNMWLVYHLGVIDKFY